jgi:hypothetical protein
MRLSVGRWCRWVNELGQAARRGREEGVVVVEGREGEESFTGVGSRKGWVGIYLWETSG